MHRRRFLVRTGQAAFLGCLAPVNALSQTSLPTQQGDRTSSPAKLIGNLEKIIPRLMDQAIVPGLSMAIVSDGRLLWRRGFGRKNNATKELVDDDTVFEAASVSKTVFAYAVMKLCEKGTLNLDAPLVSYGVKPLVEGDERCELITARHILSHSGGLQDWRSSNEPLRIHFKPGEGFLYSGEGYYYLQSTVTQLTGKTDPGACGEYEAGFEVCATDIDSYLKRNLLAPFGMSSSGYVWTDAYQIHAARPHDTSGKPGEKKRPSAIDAARYASAGGLHTTASDYAKFLLEILEPRDPDEYRLTREQRQEMLRPQVRLPAGQLIDGADSWGLGWAIQQRKTGHVLVHSGGQDGFRSLVMASVERKSGFVILTNSDNGAKIFMDQEFGGIVNRLLPA